MDLGLGWKVSFVLASLYLKLCFVVDKEVGGAILSIETSYWFSSKTDSNSYTKTPSPNWLLIFGRNKVFI